MGLQLGWWTIDVLDAEPLARFYEALLGWERLFEDATGIAMVPALPPTLGQGFLLYLDHDSGPKQHKNRAHVDLRPRDQHAAIARAVELGATRLDIGQGDVSWAVLADPAGNEFCILASAAKDADADDAHLPDTPDDTHPDHAAAVTVEAWTLDVRDVEIEARFWSALLGWHEVDRDADSIQLRDPSGRADDLLLLANPDPRRGKNRVHPDLFPDTGDGERARQREVERALDLGAARADIGQGDVPWAVLADPEGNEFCILRPQAAG